AGLGLAPLLAVLPRRGYVPDFLAPPPQAARPDVGCQLAQVRATDPAQVSRELLWCRETVHTVHGSRMLDGLLTNPEGARDQLAGLLHDAWARLVAPSWARIRALLERDIEERSRALARRGLRALDELHPK